MADVQTPHFDLPFRLQFGSAAVVEQDSIADVANCVTAIVSTHLGWRDEVPTFGIPDLTFRKEPISVSEIESMIEGQEPRADLFITEGPDRADELIDRINIGVSTLVVNS